jgi:serine/threonine-protein kinase
MPLQVGDVLKDRYRIESVLGEGGMGTVYMAQDLLLDRPRAIKELYSDPLADEAELHAARLQFEQEAQALSKLRHRNLPHVSDYFSIDENDYLVMDYIAGESLGSILARKKRPTEPLASDWLSQILEALDYCHQHHVLHRDVKPANLILTPEGRITLVDFGLVKLVDPHNPRTATIVRGLGTPQYTPLEQYDANRGHTDARSDIYALGATFYHLLTGRAPQPVSQRILNPDTQAPLQQINPKVSPWMAHFVAKAMAIRPEERYQSTSEMRRELDTRVFKLKRAGQATTTTQATAKAKPRTKVTARRPAARAASRRAQKTRTHLASKRKGTTQRQHRPLTGRTTSQDVDDMRETVRRLMPIALPVAVPVAVIFTLTVVVSIIFATGSTLLAAAVIAPLVFSAWTYYKLKSGRSKKPPRF